MTSNEVKSFKDLVVWQKGMIMVQIVYRLTGQFPEEEKFDLTSQMRRCAVSIPSNIAEGSKRGTRKDYVSFLRIAFGSLAELETQLLLARDLKFVDENEIEETKSLLIELSKMLNAMIKRLNL